MGRWVYVEKMYSHTHTHTHYDVALVFNEKRGSRDRMGTNEENAASQGHQWSGDDVLTTHDAIHQMRQGSKDQMG